MWNAIPSSDEGENQEAVSQPSPLLPRVTTCTSARVLSSTDIAVWFKKGSVSESESQSNGSAGDADDDETVGLDERLSLDDGDGVLDKD